MIDNHEQKKNIEWLIAEDWEVEKLATDLRTSMLPKVREISMTSISSAFDDRARRRARVSSIPCLN